MTNEEKAIIKGKKWEARLGLFFLIPPILGIISFILQLFSNDKGFATFRMFRGTMWTGTLNWDNYNGGGGGYMSALPVFLGLLAIAGGWLLKGNLQYLFMKKENPEESNQETTTKE